MHANKIGGTSATHAHRGDIHMNVHRIKLTSAALFAVFAVADANAVHVSPNGTGQVLIFPYYTVRNGFNTLLSVTNTQKNTKAVKVQFREGMNGRDVMNFNLFLSPNDTWTGAVLETQQGARLVTNDNSCVTPADLFLEIRVDPLGRPLNEFKNYMYSGGNEELPSFTSLDRTREGYFEIVEMGVIDPVLSPTASQIVANINQDSLSMANNCTPIDTYDAWGGNPSPIRFPNTGAALMSPPSGGLMGRASLINAASGANYSYGPTVLDGWSSQVAYAEAGNSRAGALLSDASPATSMVTSPNGTVIAKWANGRDAVTAALMRDSLINEFVLDAGTESQTDWIVTLPTKPYYTDKIYGNSSPSVSAPFDRSFSSNTTTGCDGYTPEGMNREGVDSERYAIYPATRPPNPQGAEAVSRFCRTANVLPFKSAAVTGAFPYEYRVISLLDSPTPSLLEYYFSKTVMGAISTPRGLTTPTLRVSQGPNGRATLRFNKVQQELTPISAVLISPSGTQTSITGKHFGLPVIGVMLHNYRNTNVVSRYGGVVEHSFSVRVE